jgi:hypothetical protein
MSGYAPAPDDRAYGTGNPPADNDLNSNAVALCQAILAQLAGYPGNSVIPTDNNANAANALTLLGNYVVPGLVPSGDTTGATDHTNIAAALAAGGACILQPAGTTAPFYINAPIVVPDQGMLLSVNPSWGIPTGNYGKSSLPLQGAVIQPVSGFTGTGAIQFNPTGDSASQHGGQRLYGITINGNSLSGGNTVDGIQSTGYVAGVKMRDVVVFGAFGGELLHLVTDGNASHVPDFWQLDSVKLSGGHANGADVIGLADSWIVNSEASGCTGIGWKFNNSSGTRMIGCRGNDNGTGLAWDGLSGFTGNFLVNACQFASNTTGITVSGSGTGTILLNAVDAHSNTTQYTYAGTNNVESNAAWSTSTGAPTFA